MEKRTWYHVPRLFIKIRPLKFLLARVVRGTRGTRKVLAPRVSLRYGLGVTDFASTAQSASLSFGNFHITS